MKKADIVIVGGSAAGIEAAITAQKQYSTKKVIVVQKEEKALEERAQVEEVMRPVGKYACPLLHT